MDTMTIGDLRFVEESTVSWNMLIGRILDVMQDVPASVKEKISGLDRQYREGFRQFFEEARKKDAARDADEIWDAFEIEWRKKCPDFYDVRKMLADCPPQQLEQAEKQISDAQQSLSAD